MSQHSPLQKALAWATHAFTASGMIAGFYAILFIGDRQFVYAFICLAIAFFIDAVDGTFARLFKVKEVLPNMNGGMIDAVVDFANYAIIPAYFMYEAGQMVDGEFQYMLPEAWRWLAVGAILLVSGMYYGKEGMISTDMYFIGFPVMWNAVGFYFFFVFGWSPWVNFGLVLFLAVMHFVPIKYLYPSRTTRFMIVNVIASLMIFGANLGILFAAANGKELWWLTALSILSLSYFAVMSVYHTYFDKVTRSV